jgi:ABC-2 type transport system permease protein
LFPLNILPPGIEHILNFTPFPYLLFFPVSVYLGQIKGAALGRGLALQAAWVGFFYVLARTVWRRGLRKYSAVGG